MSHDIAHCKRQLIEMLGNRDKFVVDTESQKRVHYLKHTAKHVLAGMAALAIGFLVFPSLISWWAVLAAVPLVGSALWCIYMEHVSDNYEIERLSLPSVETQTRLNTLLDVSDPLLRELEDDLNKGVLTNEFWTVAWPMIEEYHIAKNESPVVTIEDARTDNDGAIDLECPQDVHLKAALRFHI